MRFDAGLSVASRFDALIVGAGPAGASAAILLAKAGWQVALIEKQPFPRRKVCGECLAPSNLPLLDALGIGTEFMAQAGPPLRRVALMRGSRSVVADLPPAAHPTHVWGRALARETLDNLLLARARAAGVTVLQPWAVQKISGQPGSHHCTLREAITGRLQALSAPVAILAHGSWEPLPAARAEQRQARRGSDLLAFKATFDGASLSPGLLPVLAFEGGYGGMVLADRGQLTLACCIRTDRLDALRRHSGSRAAGDVVEAMLRRECQGVARALRHAERRGAWLASGPLAPGMRLQHHDALLRIGNAAGEAHPIIGEGMSMALQSAWLLSAELVAARQQRGMLAGTSWQHDVRRRYTTQWRQHFAPRMRLAAAFAHLVMRPTGSAALMALLARFPCLLTRGVAWGGKLRCVVDDQTVDALAGRALNTKLP